MLRSQQKITRHPKKQKSMAKLKDQNKSLEIHTKEMEIYELPDKEFKTTVIRMLNEIKESIILLA